MLYTTINDHYVFLLAERLNFVFNKKYIMSLKDSPLLKTQMTQFGDINGVWYVGINYIIRVGDSHSLCRDEVD